MTDSVTVIGASGALGYGLALRLGIAGTHAGIRLTGLPERLWQPRS